eukprot:TRINITY_DN992_c0_g1_i1.p1 TRINITY_DN992_c0_g1~~TRINITY_DN992_c0_g1_i1.p1  ORF type:complete len:309 (+),score=44.21 TRINITY_DN992_c0_g1_i1:31-927(+)
MEEELSSSSSSSQHEKCGDVQETVTKTEPSVSLVSVDNTSSTGTPNTNTEERLTLSPTMVRIEEEKAKGKQIAEVVHKDGKTVIRAGAPSDVMAAFRRQKQETKKRSIDASPSRQRSGSEKDKSSGAPPTTQGRSRERSKTPSPGRGRKNSDSIPPIRKRESMGIISEIPDDDDTITNLTPRIRGDNGTHDNNLTPRARGENGSHVRGRSPQPKDKIRTTKSRDKLHNTQKDEIIQITLCDTTYTLSKVFSPSTSGSFLKWYQSSNKFFSSGSTDGTVTIYDADQGKSMLRFKVYHTD